METNTTQTWITDELKQQNKGFDGERLPAMKFEENKVIEFTVDFSAPFQKWNGEQNGKPVTKAIVPCVHEGQKKVWWLSTQNPTYYQLLELGKSGTTDVRILQTGTQDKTRYVLVK